MSDICSIKIILERIFDPQEIALTQHQPLLSQIFYATKAISVRPAQVQGSK